MSGFDATQWEIISRKLEQNPAHFGIPIRRNKSIILGSFNALKIGKAGNKDKKWDFLTRFASRYDLLAIQEVMDDLSGIRRLHQSLGSGFKLVVSDTTGAFPGHRGLRERLAFLYRPSRIELKELVSDITYDRSIITKTLKQDIDLWRQFFTSIDEENERRLQQGKKRKSLSDFAHPTFLTFIRTPFCASFSVKGKNNSKPLEFLGVNAHTLFGKSKKERNYEFFALLDWIVQRAKSPKRMYYNNMIIMADLNLSFDDASVKYSEIIQRIHELKNKRLSGQNAARVNFPFLDVHPNERSLFNTNARKNQTFDHIAFFIDQHETKLPQTFDNRNAGNNGTNGYDYGVFDFVELFSQALHGSSFNSLSKSERNNLLKHAKADVSDHMPIWTRIPIPGA